MHNFGEGYHELLQQQRVEWEAAHPDATLPPLQLPVVPEGEAIGTNRITACLLYTSPSPRDRQKSRMPSSA